MTLKSCEDKKLRKMKQLIAVGILAPSLVRGIFPHSVVAVELSNMATVLASLIWLWET